MLLVTIGLLGLGACGGPPATRLSRLYSGLDEALPPVDPSILTGRRILVDPGHGGAFRGTMGRDSLEESSVNLGVSLYLWGLLREAGAEVTLTRSTDRDFLSIADSSIASDLRMRVAMSDSLAPDIFISIHHNAQPQRDPNTNRVETYYKAGDPASLDLAFAIHRHLMRNLGIDTGEVRQGNYLVLRENQIPSVLGESSYLTHPDVEDRIKLSDVQRLEAEAYFLGILDYFNRGIVRIERQAPMDSIVAEVPTLIYQIRDDGGDGVDPEGVDLRVNGQPVNAAVDPPGMTVIGADPMSTAVVYSLPEDAPNGSYAVDLVARNLRGNTSALHRAEFVIDHPAEHAIFSSLPARLPPSTGGTASIRVRLLDSRGLAVADGSRVVAAVGTGADSLYGTTIDGVFAFPAPFVNDGPLVINVESNDRTFSHTFERVQRKPGGPTIPPPPQWSALTIVDAISGAPVKEATVTYSRRTPDRSEEGVYYVYSKGGLSVRAHGYVPLDVARAESDTLRMTPWFDAVLADSRFVLDPEGGRSADVGAGPLGLSANLVNLRVAEYLAGYLQAAGASVRLTRTNEEIRAPEDIARLTNRFGATRYLEIRHRALPSDSALAAHVYHFPGSTAGARMALDLGRVLAETFKLPPRPPTSLVTYPLQQTACPAIVVSYPSIADRNEEQRLGSSAYLRDQAYATFVGILEHFAAPDTATVTVRIDAHNPSGWLVTMDDTWSLQTSARGMVRFSVVSGGTHQIRARRAGKSVSTRISVDGASTTVFIRPGD